MSAFRGSYKHSIDHKGRVSIPSRFRKQLSGEANETFVVLRGFESCIFLYPLDEFRQVEERLRARSFTDETNRRFQRMFLLEARDEMLDGQGRIALPPPLVAHAQIGKEVVIAGQLDHLEVWNPELLDAYLKNSAKSYEEIAGELLL